MTRKQTIHNIYLILSALLILFGTYLILTMGGSFSFVGLRFFTVLSNLYVALSFIILVFLGEKKAAFRNQLFLSATVSISITGLVYNLVLVPFAGADPIFAYYANFSVHLLAMVLALFNYFVFEQKGHFKYIYLWAACAPPLLYWASFMVIGAITNASADFYPYFFMNPPQIGWLLTLMWLGILVVIILGLTCLLILFDKRRRKQSC